jgi:hypothetical protein
MTIIVGQLATHDGTSLKEEIVVDADGWWSAHNKIYKCPASAYRAEQPSSIGVDVNHQDPMIGQVLFLAQRGNGLFAVADVDPDWLPEPPWYLSAESEGRWDGITFTDATLQRVAVVNKSATIAKRQAVAVTGTLEEAHLHWHNEHRPLLKEAADYCRVRRFQTWEPHVVAPDPVAVRQHRVANGPPPRLGPIHYATGEILAIR